MQLDELIKGDWMDAIPSRFINELPNNNIENEVIEERKDEEFDFNQDNSIELGEEYRSPDGIDLRKN